jgi:PAS domain-containing protein
LQHVGTVRRQIMTDARIDYREVFQALPGLVALLTPELVYADANEEFCRSSGRSRDQLLGRYLFDVFPDNPEDPAATGASNLRASLMRVLESGERDTMALQRYDVESTERPGEWQERYWSPVNLPGLKAGAAGLRCGVLLCAWSGCVDGCPAGPRGGGGCL